MNKHTAIFNKKPKRKPIKAPKPAFNASLNSFLPINSPTTAPKNGPKIIPNGWKNKPITVPIAQPQLPYFVHPNLLAPIIGVT